MYIPRGNTFDKIEPVFKTNLTITKKCKSFGSVSISGICLGYRKSLIVPKYVARKVRVGYKIKLVVYTKKLKGFYVISKDYIQKIARLDGNKYKIITSKNETYYVTKETLEKTNVDIGTKLYTMFEVLEKG